MKLNYNWFVRTESDVFYAENHHKTRKEARESMARLKTAFKSLPDVKITLHRIDKTAKLAVMEARFSVQVR